jgi:hypothetical protein
VTHTKVNWGKIHLALFALFFCWVTYAHQRTYDARSPASQPASFGGLFDLDQDRKNGVLGLPRCISVTLVPLRDHRKQVEYIQTAAV